MIHYNDYSIGKEQITVFAMKAYNLLYYDTLSLQGHTRPGH